MKKTFQYIQVKLVEPIPVFCNNTNAISISNNPMMYSKMKHNPIKYHFFREKVTENNIKLEYVGTKEQVTDIFTKPLPCKAFEYLRQKLGILRSSHYIFLIQKIKGEWKCVQVHRMVVCQEELPFSIDVKQGRRQ